MIVYAITEFKEEYEKLKKHKSYKNLEKEIINYFFIDKGISDIQSGTRLNNDDLRPYVKKRLAGKGGYRMYFFILIKDENVYLIYVHPKTGKFGVDNIDDDSKALLYKRVLESIQDEDLWSVTHDKRNDELVFTKEKQVKNKRK